MAPKQPQPCVEGAKVLVSQKTVESRVCPGQWHGREGSLYHGQRTGVSSTTQRRVDRNATSCDQVSEDGRNNLVVSVKGEVMSDFTLSEMESAFLSREWVMDPPPWIAVKLDERILVDIYRVKLEALAKVADLEIQAKKIEQDMYHQIARTLG